MARPTRRPGRQAQVTGLLLAASVVACASQGDPPGGPPDVAPPKIVRVVPESGAVVANLKDDAVIHFDEVIDEMPGTGGAAGSLARQVLLSPAAGGVRVSWHRDNISVKPREGWKRRVYRLEILPGILDLRRNRLDTAKIVLFSTGPEIGHARLGGIALAWVEQRILANALIEAVPLPDSVGYLTQADSGGQFNLEGLAPGRYIVYAVADANSDRRRGLREAYDSAAVTLDSSSNVALYTFVHDTVPARLRGATALDSMNARLEFTQPLDPATRLDTSNVRVLLLPDSTPVRVTALVPQRQFDSLAAAARAKADSATPRDTAGRQRVGPPGGPPGPPRVPDRPGPPAPAPEPLVDTALVRRLLALRPVPVTNFVLTFANRLTPEARYLILIDDATNLTKRTANAQAVLVVPKPAAADTTRRAPTTPSPQPPGPR